jgi:serine protease
LAKRCDIQLSVINYQLSIINYPLPITETEILLMLFRYLFLFILILSFSGCKFDDDDDSSNTGVSLSGRILVASNTAKDNDVNDVNTEDTSNDDIFTPQIISNPVILGGYVNQPEVGTNGQLKAGGDKNDFYEVDLRAGQTIMLFIGNSDLLQNDLDLALLDRNGFVLNASVGDRNVESLNVPTDGRYFIQVQALFGASNYVLSIGQTIQATTLGMRLTDDFASQQAIVQLAPQTMKQAQSALTALGMKTQSVDTSRNMLFTFETSQAHSFSTHHFKFATPKLRTKYETLIKIKALRKRRDIAQADPNYQRFAMRVPNDTLWDRYQWGHTMINLPQAWDTTVGDSSVIVAIPDTGVLLQHPDLQNKFVQGYDFVASRFAELDTDLGIDPNPNDPGDQFPGGSTFHGTHVAGIVAALSNNNEGVAGVSWLTQVMPLRVLGKGGAGFDYDIEQGIRFAAGLPNDSGIRPAKRADIINLSLGGGLFSNSLQQLMTQVHELGIFIVASAGNDNIDVPMFPASLEGVISVGALDMNKKRAFYSNYGRDLDVMAPGGDSNADINGDGMPDGILSTIGDDQSSGQLGIEFSYRPESGTSMAAPHIAGVISLMKAVNPALTPQDFDNLLESGRLTDDLGPNGRDDEFGYGIINAQKAVLAATELGGGVVPPPTPPLLVVNPRSLNFGLAQTRLTLTLSNGGGGDLQILNISENSGGFLAIEGSGLGDYFVTLNRNGLAFGTFTATMTIISNINNITIPVIWQVGDPSITGDAGLHYVLLIDNGTLDTVQQIQTSSSNGVYNFQFNNVPYGEHLIVAGSDFNNNGFICDDGEACGAYLTLDRPSAINITGSRSDIEFNTGFTVNFLSQTIIEDNRIPPEGFALLKNEYKSFK